MVTPERYDSVGRPPASDWKRGETQEVVDRLEAALDEALLAHAAEPGPRVPGAARVRIALRSLNDRLSSSWRWTKWGMERLFRERLAARYAASGWGRARADYDSDESRWMEFSFGEPPAPEIDGVGAGDLLGMARELADALGADPPRDGPGWLREAVDDLRVAAKYRMLDLEAARREAAER